MKNRFLIKIIVSILIINLSIFLPLYKLSFDDSTMLTIVSLIFAILVGFFIATATSNYLRLQTLLVNEDNNLINIFNIIKIIDQNNINKASELIYKYTTSTLNFKLTEYVYKTRVEFNNLLSYIDSLRPVNQEGIQLFESLHNNKSELIRSRQEILLVSKRIITPLHWIVLIILAILMMFLIFGLRDGNWLTFFITAFLSVSIFLILTLLYEVDNNIFLEEILAYNNSQEVFKMIDKPEYFPKLK